MAAAQIGKLIQHIYLPSLKKEAESNTSESSAEAVPDKSGALAGGILTDVWNKGCDAPLVTSRRHGASIATLGFLGDDSSVASCDGDGNVRFWNAVDLKPTGGPITAFGRAMALSPTGDILAIGAADSHGVVELWCLDTGQPIARLETASNVQALAFSPDGETLAARVAGDWRVHLLSISTGKRYRVLGPEADSGTTSPGKALLAYLPYGRFVATTNRARTNILFFDVVSGEAAGTPLRDAVHCGNLLTSLFFKGQEVCFEDFALSPDGRTLAACGNDRAVRLWNVEDGQQICDPLLGHSRRVNSVAFSPDGRILASCANDRKVLLWDVRQGKQLGAPLAGHLKPVTVVAFSGDNRVLASGSNDRTVRLWVVPPMT
ncbi:WD40 repeat domain-containing protein [Streptomyces sp. NPDC046915]|uniref:WD40 repeat domain-containing protein n=1 Tax=Streptomyces sp. NPDC046915 TaxID=3155257 RepID=UPI0033D3F650